jgi:hypothetical protein
VEAHSHSIVERHTFFSLIKTRVSLVLELLLSLLAFLLLIVESWVYRQWTELVLESMLATAIDRLNFLSDKKI